jgi:hypothetical protein
MKSINQIVDFAGIVLFDPELLAEYFGAISEGDNLYKIFTTTDDGEKVVEKGIVVPILGINDSNYEIHLRWGNEPSLIPDDLFILENGIFPLHIKSKLVIADMAVLVEWIAGMGWTYISDVPPGFYEANIKAFRKIESGEVTRFGFEIVLNPSNALPEMSGDLEKDMQVLYLDDE